MGMKKLGQKHNHLYLHDKNLLELPGMVSALKFFNIDNLQ